MRTGHLICNEGCASIREVRPKRLLCGEASFNLQNVHFLVANFLPCELLERNAAVLAQFKKPTVELDSFALVKKQLLHNIVD